MADDCQRIEHHYYYHGDQIVARMLREIVERLDDHHAHLVSIQEQGEKIMSAISDFASKVTAHQDKIDTAITGLQGDVDELNKKIAELQSSPGTITPEDQASLDAIEARAAAMADKLDALDALTPPAAPPTA